MKKKLETGARRKILTLAAICLLFLCILLLLPWSNPDSELRTDWRLDGQVHISYVEFLDNEIVVWVRNNSWYEIRSVRLVSILFLYNEQWQWPEDIEFIMLDYGRWVLPFSYMEHRIFFVGELPRDVFYRVMLTVQIDSRIGSRNGRYHDLVYEFYWP